MRAIFNFALMCDERIDASVFWTGRKWPEDAFGDNLSDQRMPGG
jgi:hypothetical protein